MAVGAYRPGASFFHRLDPRSKVLLVGALSVYCCFSHSPAVWLGLSLLVLFQAFLSGSDLKTISLVLAGVLPLALISLFFQTVLTPGTPLYPASPWGSWEGLARGGEFAWRFMLLACLCQFFVFSTSPFRFCRALEWFLAPLAWLGLPVRDLALVAGLSLKFVPVLSFEADRLMKAQSARGAYIDHGPWSQRLTGMLSILVPLLVRVFRYSDDLSIAMEVRGYSSTAKRSELFPLRFSAADWWVVVAVTLGTVVAVVMAQNGVL